MVHLRSVDQTREETVENPLGSTGIRFSMISRQRPSRVRYVLPGLAERTVGGIVGPGGLGKSMLLLQTCMSVGAGEDLFQIWGERPIQGGALYLGFEDPRSVVEERLFKLSNLLSVGKEVREAIDESCEFHSLFGSQASPAIARKERLGGPVTEHPWFAAVRAELSKPRDVPLRLVVIDTLNRSISAGGLDENSNADMSRVISLLELLCEETGCAVVFAHHVSKGAAAGGKRDQQAARGAGAITDNARWQANLSVKSKKGTKAEKGAKEELEEILLEVTKANYGPKPRPITLIRHNATGALIGQGMRISVGRRRSTQKNATPTTPAVELWDDDI